MNCGYCAEFCPFDAIKMDHDYELSSYDRTWKHIYDKQKLSKPFSYWVSIAPTTAHEEAEARGGWEHPDVIKEFKKSGGTPTPVTEPWEAMKTHAAERVKATAQPAPTSEVAATTPEAAPAAAPEDDAEAAAKAERLRKREEALARKRAREQGGG
jgi:NADH-quinone oxidoreductase subunit I